jgi:hypothetical protein
MFIGVALASFATGAGVARAQVLYNVYVPATTKFTDLGSGTGRIVCVIGYSKPKTFATADYSFPVPTYYLASGGWSPVTGITNGSLLMAVQVGSGPGMIGSIPTQPASTPPNPNSKGYINAGNVAFYVVDNPPTGFSCTQITYKWIDVANGIVEPSTQPYPVALQEISIYPKQAMAGDGGVSAYMTVDQSNVDNFQMPSEVAVQDPSGNDYAYYGNPVASPLMSRETAVTGPPSNTVPPVTGGPATSPFVNWLSTQNNSNSNKFKTLALASPPYPFADISAPDKFLQFRCQQTSVGGVTKYIPEAPNCKTNGDVGRLVYYDDDLNKYYDEELKTFFANAVGGTKLVVMGDASGSYTPPAPWTVEAPTPPASCPVYLNHPSTGDGSLQFGASTVPFKIILCNPFSQEPMAGGVVAGYIQSPVLHVPQTATMLLTFEQCIQARQYINWNFAQPSSGFVGQITDVTCLFVFNIMTVTVLNGPGTFMPGPPPVISQNTCIATVLNPKDPLDNGCPRANTNFDWIFSNAAYVGTVQPGFTASDMVHGNKGVFADWMATYYVGDQMIIAQSIGRNIVQAFSHGLANCNNIITTCAGMTALTSADMNPSSAASTSSAWWSNEGNWYRRGGTQDYYAQYLHTAQVPMSPATPTTNIFVPPQPVISQIANSNQGVPMGMAYGFGFDENPGYPSGTPAYVPSKFDAIPVAWFPPMGPGLKSLDIRIGRSK